MNVLVLGGTGLISTGIVRALHQRGAHVTLYNRNQRASQERAVTTIVGDRSAPGSLERAFERARYDVVVDMICFTKEEAESTVRAFGGRCEQLIFCSTVCTYGTKTPPNVLVDERFPQEPTTPYAKAKLACEHVFRRAEDDGRFRATIVRPSQTYGPGGPLLDQLEIEGVAWDRVLRGLPVFAAGDGLGLWQATHRDDCAKLFAYAAGNPRTYGEAYNATVDEVFTWRDYHREAAAALDTKAMLVLAPAAWLTRALPHRFSFLREISRFHGAYCPAKAKTHVPEFRTTIGFQAGARETLADLRRRGAWPNSEADTEYEALVNRALELGFELVEA